MSLYDLLLFLHVLGAFTLVAGTVVMAPFAVGIGGAAFERIERARVAAIGAILSGVGAVMVVVLGLWLVANVGYQFFRFWIIAALVLVAVAGYCNGQVSRTARAVAGGEESRRDLRVIWAVDLAGAALILVLMLFKPGH